ncbi:MAG: hypothetical protein Ct9H90mP2_02180 [Dehalococcoidia bacterium]|nr:MAG: hypothetical protein Ct9H90mP2_02180 [Dehalococcoidia bacterium]
MEGRRYSDGLHQAIESKESVQKEENLSHTLRLHYKIILGYITNYLA